MLNTAAGYLKLLVIIAAGSLIAALPATAQTEDPASVLLQAARQWLEGQPSDAGAELQLQPLDSRILVPTCTEGFQFSFQQSQKKAIFAECAGTAWSLYLQTRVVLPDAGPRFRRDLPAGHRITAQDLDPVPEVPAATPPASAVEGMFLRLGVRAGQPVSQTALDEPVVAFKTRETIMAGTQLHGGLLEQVWQPASLVPAGRAVDEAQVMDARAVRRLPAGYIITTADIAEKTRVVVASGTIARGTLVSDQNVSESDFWGRLPQDAITRLANLPRAVSVGTVQAGDVIRLSALRILPPVAKGDAVTVTVRRNQLEISHTVRARQDGQIGQQIELLNEESGEVIRGTVTGIATARLP